MKAVILTGNQPNQVALCNKLAAHCGVAAIVLSRNIARKRKPLRERWTMFANRLAGRVVGRPFLAAWQSMQVKYQESYPLLPAVPTVCVDNVNDAPTLDTLKVHEPDVVIVSGTNLVGRRVIELGSRKLGVINLHTGISPYVKGGPNCTNWCLAERWLHLIGSTVMWIDLGVDSGPLIATERTPLDGTETLSDLHWKVMEHGHDLYVRVVEELAAGRNVPSVSQRHLPEGKTFTNVEWNGLAMRRALTYFRRNYSREAFHSDSYRRALTACPIMPLSHAASKVR